jgi:hypothetical protein
MPIEIYDTIKQVGKKEARADSFSTLLSNKL